MSTPKDLSRWNRAGLRRLIYVDGNAPRYLDQLREAFASHFPGRWSNLPGPVTVGDEQDLLPERLQFERNRKLVEQYQGERRDMGWELARVFARACHVLTAHIDAHANESFLRTATQWEHLRRLVATIDYQPAPATSATTALVIQAKPGKRGVVPQGFQVKYTPPTGGSQVIFETFTDIEIDAALNELRPKGWDQSEDPLVPPDSGGAVAASGSGGQPGPGAGGAAASGFRSGEGPQATATGAGTESPADSNSTAPVWTPFVAPRKPRVEPGQIAIVSHPHPNAQTGEQEAKAVTIAKIDESSRFISLQPSSANGEYNWRQWEKGDTQLLVAPHWQRKCWLNGNDVIRTEEPHGLTAGAFVSWKEVTEEEEEDEKWQFAEVIEADDWNLRLRIGTGVDFPGKDTQIVEALPLQDENLPAKYANIGFIGDELQSGDIQEIKAEDLLDRQLPKLPPICAVPPPAERQSDFEFILQFLGKLPNVGNFLVPTPLLPVDLVKEAIKLLLKMGAMLIPSTGEPVFEFIKSRTAFISNLTNQIFDLVDKAGSLQWACCELRMDNVSSVGDLNTAINNFKNEFQNSDICSVLIVYCESEDEPDESEDEPVCEKSWTVAGFKEDKTTFVSEEPNPELSAELAVEGPVNETKILELALQQLGRELPQPDEPTVKDQIRNALNLTVPDEEEAQPVFFKTIAKEALNKGALLIPQDYRTKAVVTEKRPLYVYYGNHDKIAIGDWVVAQFKFEGAKCESCLRAVQVREIRDRDETIQDTSGSTDTKTDVPPRKTFGLSFHSLKGNEGELEMVYADFRGQLTPQDSRINTARLDSDVIELDVDRIPESLKRGRKVLLTAEGEGDSVEATVVNVAGKSIKFDRKPPPFTKSKFVIHGNLVAAGHGATVPPIRLSSGAASSGFQSLLLEVENVSSLPDPTFPRGVRAGVQVMVDNLIWKQMPRLNQSGPTDPHYAVRATEDGFLRLVFGDGVHGRRLPSGTNNVQVSYRVGAGRSGNLPPGRLTKPVHPHPLVASVLQPSDSVGGEEMEATEQVREKAPATLLALERAVSLVDFENLAVGRNDVWQARAFYHPAAGSFLDQVRVGVIPAGGGKVDGPFKQELEAFLSQHALPTVSVRVVDVRQCRVKLDIKVRVDKESFDANEVLQRVREALLAALQLERRRIGQAFYISEVYHLVEGVKGVADSRCAFAPYDLRLMSVGNALSAAGHYPPSARHLLPRSEAEVIYLSEDPDDLTIDYEDYRP